MVTKILLYRFPYVIYGVDAPHQSSTRATKESRSIAATGASRARGPASQPAATAGPAFGHSVTLAWLEPSMLL